MNARRKVKISVNMFDDTKLKIIDTKPERDLIHYIWFRMVTLAGKDDRDGELFLSSNIPFTPETLAIEFNRGTYQINLALDILIELEMIDIVNGNVYRVKNFSKHQNGNRNTKSNKNAKEEKLDNNIEEEKELKADMRCEYVEDKKGTNNENTNKKENNRSGNKKNNRKNNNKDIIDKIQTASLIDKGGNENEKNITKTKRIEIKEIEGEEELVNLYDGEIKIKDGTVISSWNFDNTR